MSEETQELNEIECNAPHLSRQTCRVSRHGIHSKKTFWIGKIRQLMEFYNTIQDIALVARPKRLKWAKVVKSRRKMPFQI